MRARQIDDRSSPLVFLIGPAFISAVVWLCMVLPHYLN